MISKLTAFLQQAAEVTSQVLAPAPSRSEEFQGHWKAITDCIVSDSDAATVEAGGIAERLEQMVDLLCQEEEERDHRDPGTMGPCMEFLLRHKILDTLHTAGKSDYPAGMRHEVLLFFTVLLGRVERSLLPHVSVHQAVQKQIGSVCEVGLGVVATDEVQFLRTLCLKLHHDPRLADFFLEDSKGGQKKFILAEALLKLVNSQDSLVVMKAYECLLTCSSLPHPVVAQALAASRLPILLGSQLQFHLQLIPTSIHHSTIISCHAGWGVDYATRNSTSHLSPSSHGIWHVEAFFSWLDYCEQVVNSAAQPLSDALCAAIHELLLVATVLPKLSKTTEEEILIATAVLTRCIQFLTCRRLLREFMLFILNDSLLVEESPVPLKQKLVQHTDHISNEVCQVTLQLFDVLLQASLPDVVHELVLQYWKGSQVPQLVVPPEELAAQRQDLEEDTKSYLSLVPDHLSSSRQVTGDTGLENYLIEAHQQVAKFRALSMMWSSTGLSREGIERDSVTTTMGPEPSQSSREQEVASVECQTSSGSQHSEASCSAARPGPQNCSSSDLESVCEGPFLAALLTKLERLLDQSYEVNLLLTSILSTLAAFPHPMMEQWLFATTCSHSRNVYSILKKLCNDLQTHAQRSPGLLVSIVEARRRLTGMETSDLLSMPHNDLLEGAIVLEEFSKELGAVLYAKKSTAMLTLLPP